MSVLNLLSGGAAQGLVEQLQARFEAETGAKLQARFGAVGAMKEALLAGEACDVFLVTDSMIDALTAESRLRAGTKAALGGVATAIAVRTSEQLPDVSTAEALGRALAAASALYAPDPERATAGTHFAGVLRRLGLHEALNGRFRSFPNGATAMRALARSRGANEIGCTQASEILRTEGLVLVGPLPAPFELTTVYAAAIAAATQQGELASRLIALLSGQDAQALRLAAGFSNGQEPGR